MIKRTWIALGIAVLAAACAVSEGPASEADELAPEEQETLRATAEDGEAALEALMPTTDDANFCEPGPSSNWCENVDGKACSTTNRRRCYLPNYCEWLICFCENGAWNCWQ